MKLSDLIIQHGPYEAGELSPFAGGVDRGDLNELREELIAARKPGELLKRFRLYAIPYSRGPVTFGITHDDCPGQWYAAVDDFTALDELVQRAGEHAEVCG